jgi:uncharacterized metal-binding protein YceD (DUF177 family)
MPAKDAPPVSGLSLPLRLSMLSRRGAHTVHLRPDGPARGALARDLDLLALRKLDFRGTLTAEGREDWRFEGVLGATAVQACVVSGAPVTTRVDTPVLRRFVARMPEDQGPEAEIPEDDALEPLRAQIDAGDILREALALALPDYPRAADADQSAPPASAPDPASDDGGRPNPFAVLASLKSSGIIDPGPEDDDTT